MADNPPPAPYTELYLATRAGFVRLGQSWGGDRKSVIRVTRLGVAIEKHILYVKMVFAEGLEIFHLIFKLCRTSSENKNYFVSDQLSEYIPSPPPNQQSGVDWRNVQIRNNSRTRRKK